MSKLHSLYRTVLKDKDLGPNLLRTCGKSD